jgi:hypothetical protein
MRKIFLAFVVAVLTIAYSGKSEAQETQRWRVGVPITTYYAGPPTTDATAKQMADGGFNLIWCNTAAEMDIAQKYGLRVLLHNSLLAEQTMNDPAKIAQLDAFITQVKNKPCLYGYYITDEPNASRFAALGKLVAHLRALDPAHMAYINLFPTYATNDQLGTKGDVATAYQEYLRQYIETVKPDLLSYDHYHFKVNGDGAEYFLNLGLIRQAALDAGIPFLNIVQASTWDKSMRVPNADEMRWLNYTSLAYGAQGLSYFVYYYKPFYDTFKPNAGQMMLPDGTPTPQYEAAKKLNPQFVAIASQLQPLRSLGAYHVGKKYLGAQELPQNAPFHLDFTGDNHMPADGMLLGYFGKPDKPTHVLVVNLDYHNAVTTTVVGPAKVSVFDVVKGAWKKAGSPQVTLTIPPGGGVLLRVGK